MLRDTDDPKLVVSAVEELLRYLAIPHNGRRRVALEDIEFAGGTISAGDGIILPNDIANRDPDAIADPDRLDLTRPARIELQVVYGTLNRRIPTLRRATDLDRIPFKHDGSVYGVHELPVEW